MSRRAESSETRERETEGRGREAARAADGGNQTVPVGRSGPTAEHTTLDRRLYDGTTRHT